MGWVEILPVLVQLGVKSWAAIHAIMQDAGLDDAQIAVLRPKWDALYSDVERASKPPV